VRFTWVGVIFVGVIFRPYGQNFIGIYMLFAVHTDGNLQLNFAIFRPYKH